MESHRRLDLDLLYVGRGRSSKKSIKRPRVQFGPNPRGNPVKPGHDVLPHSIELGRSISDPKSKMELETLGKLATRRPVRSE